MIVKKIPGRILISYLEKSFKISPQMNQADLNLPETVTNEIYKHV